MLGLRRFSYSIGGKKGRRRIASPRHPRCWLLNRRFRAERLEDRCLLTGVTYQGGPLINNVSVETVFLGQAWATDSSLQQEAAQLDQFFAYVTNSSYMDLLAQYGTPQAGAIDRGSYAGEFDIAQDAWRRSTVSDTTIQNTLNSEITSGAISVPDTNRLLVIFTPPDVVVSQGGSRSNGYPVGFAGYHNSFVASTGQLVRYAVIPDPIGNDQVAGLTTFQQQTAAASHELAESVTDPDGTSWWDTSNDATSGNEIGDFADLNGNVVYLNGYAVEELWSNAAGGLVAPLGATDTPTPIMPTPVTPTPTGGSSGGDSTPPAGTTSPPVAPGVPPNLGTVAESLTHSGDYYSTFVNNIYEQYFTRPADAAGLNYWTTQMALSTSDEQLEANLLSSSEYVERHGGTDVSWVAAMYQDLLGRPADSAGLTYWLGQLEAGVSEDQIALGIATSAERESIVVANDYQTFLGRGATSADVAFWVNQFEQGARNEDVIAGFISSAEYYNSPNKGQATNTAWVDSVFQDLFQTQPTTADFAFWLSQLG